MKKNIIKRRLKIVLFTLFFLFYTSLFLWSEGRVFFDSYRQLAWIINDVSIFGQSKFKELLVQKGLRPVVSSISLDELIPAIDSDDLILLSVSKFGTYSTSEVLSVKRFVNSGGKVIILGEHDDVYKVSSGLQNKILKEFGMKFLDNTISVDGRDWIRISSYRFNCKNIWLYASPEISFFGDYAYRYSDEEAVFGLYDNIGKVFAISDSEFLLNGMNNKEIQFGIGQGDNKKFLNNLFDFLLKNVRYKSKYNLLSKKKRGMKKVYIYNEDSLAFIDDEIDGLSSLMEKLKKSGFYFEFADYIKIKKDPDIPVIFLFNGSGNSKILDSLPNRFIVIGDSYSKVDNYTDNGMLLTKLKISQNIIPFYVKVLKKRGIKFVAGTIMNLENFEEEETSIFTGQKNRIRIKRAGLILPDGSGEILLKADKNCFYNPVTLGLDERVPWKSSMNKKFYDRKDVNPQNVGLDNYKRDLKISTLPESSVPPPPYALIYIKNNTMAITDLDMLTNIFLKKYKKNKIIIKWIIDFLKNKK